MRVVKFLEIFGVVFIVDVILVEIIEKIVENFSVIFMTNYPFITLFSCVADFIQGIAVFCIKIISYLEY